MATATRQSINAVRSLSFAASTLPCEGNGQLVRRTNTRVVTGEVLLRNPRTLQELSPQTRELALSFL